MFFLSTKSRTGMLVPLLGIILIACENKSEKTGASATGTNTDAARLPVDVLIAQAEELHQDETVIGTMMPYREVSIVSELAQKIIRVAFQDGSYVEEGAILYVLNDADIRARLRQLGAELELAKLNKERLDNLLKTETIKQQEYDEALMRFRSLTAQQELLRVELAKTIIRAPFSGKIGISKVHVGAYVIPGTALVTLQDQINLKINFSISEKHLPLINKGTKVRFTTALSTEQLEATVLATEPGLDAAGRNLEVQARVDNSNRKFRPGMSAKIHYSSSDRETKGVTIPTEALMPGNGGYNAYVIVNGRAKATAVSISNRTETDAVVTSGLHTGDSVIVSNMLRITEGTPVKAIIPTK
ncbi:efflux transporter periplasmic adaptor subunit [Sphingobacterium sp. CZ-UAM]|uniref:efflux RND transporter periplasmic adaptor subunit n=1 Tax=Sphingobacterium sp. CZ-UAM TaxID=1933868 RepID=UPI000987360A|nr:efflux RND transporter periplasmic adaptor subunit [Sphingobacterium sp. CZ-UAM]OOG19206.1 efflux transporter periplasmic adaptor subunit [Sphingobacterium sp. CZ-UAM]